MVSPDFTPDFRFVSPDFPNAVENAIPSCNGHANNYERNSERPKPMPEMCLRTAVPFVPDTFNSPMLGANNAYTEQR